MKLTAGAFEFYRRRRNRADQAQIRNEKDLRMTAMATPAEKREIVESEARQTYHSRQSNAIDERSPQLQKAKPSQIGGGGKYPSLATGPWSQPDPTGPEPP